MNRAQILYVMARLEPLIERTVRELREPISPTRGVSKPNAGPAPLPRGRIDLKLPPIRADPRTLKSRVGWRKLTL